VSSNAAPHASTTAKAPEATNEKTLFTPTTLL
jgi:hypothetical protein